MDVLTDGITTMIEDFFAGLLNFLMSVLPVINFPNSIVHGVQNATSFFCWLNWFLPVDIFIQCFTALVAYQISLYFFRFVSHSVSNFIKS